MQKLSKKSHVCTRKRVIDHWYPDPVPHYMNLNSLLVKRQIDNPSPGAVTGG